MSEIKLSCEWLPGGSAQSQEQSTRGQLSIHIDGLCLTRNEDVWTHSVRDSVSISAYPLALWLASSWWRLLYEPLLTTAESPSLDWRMSHEMGAAGHGFVWPAIMLATDGEVVQVWAKPSTPNSGQSVPGRDQ
jgi:hypothetical protein